MPQLKLARVIWVALVIEGARAGAGVAAPAPAPADQAERRSAARALFQEGLTHADAGRWQQAADRFSRAHSLQPTPEITYNLSTALTRVGRLVSAGELLRQVSDDGAASARVREAAGLRLVEVQKRLAYATVHVEPPGPARVWVDGRPLDAAAIGVPFAIDPGTHVFELRAGARTAASRTLSLAEGERETVTLEAAVTEKEGAARARGGGERLRSSAPDASATSRAATEPLWRKGWFFGAVGAAAVGAGVAIFLATRGTDPPRGNVETWVVRP